MNRSCVHRDRAGLGENNGLAVTARRTVGILKKYYTHTGTFNIRAWYIIQGVVYKKCGFLRSKVLRSEFSI